MYFLQNTRVKKGKSYVYSFLAESYKEDGKSKKRIIANLSDFPKALLSTIAAFFKNNKSVVSLDDLTVESSIDYGNVVVLLEIMKRLKITTLFEKKYKENAPLALLMILWKLVTQGSKLGIVHWIKRNPIIAEKLWVNIKALSEKDCYKALVDIDNIQWTLEKEWYTMHKGKPISIKNEKDSGNIENTQNIQENKSSWTIYLYDITSLYFEGTENELAMFGYNRDKKAGKKIITVGLITNEEGFPLKIQVFQGNTVDSATVTEQIQTIKQEFHVKHLILVGDRGMRIRYNLEHMNDENTDASTVRNWENGENWGIEYISWLTNNEIQTLMDDKIIQLTLFDKELVEVSNWNKRYVLCVNPKLEKEKQTTRAELKAKFETELTGVQKSYNLQKQKCIDNRAKFLISKKKSSKSKIELTKKELESWNYKVRKASEKYHMQKIYTVTITEEAMKIEYNPLSYEEVWRLDWKYVFETTVPKEVLSKEEVRHVYKQLQRVEHAFRDMKTVELELRPVFHRQAQTTRGHIFLGMLSYAVQHEFEKCIFPYLREDEQKREKTSLEDILEELKMIRQVTLSFWKHKHVEVKTTKLTEKQKKILELLHLDADILTK